VAAADGSTEGTREPVSHVDDCKKFIACLSEHFDGELPAELEAEFMLHYRTCERARTIVRTFERTIILHQRNPRAALPKDVHERLMAAIKACQGCDDDS
jgi:anti-sigma factor RsiW